MLNLVLVLEASRGAFGGCEGGNEDPRGWGQCFELGGPVGGVGGDEGGEFCLWGFACGLGSSARDRVDGADCWVFEEAGEDVGSLLFV